MQKRAGEAEAELAHARVHMSATEAVINRPPKGGGAPLTLYLASKTIHATPHIGDTQRQPDPCAALDRDHRSTATTN